MNVIANRLHAVNIAEDVIYMAKGDILRHRRADEPAPKA